MYTHTFSCRGVGQYGVEKEQEEHHGDEEPHVADVQPEDSRACRAQAIGKDGESDTNVRYYTHTYTKKKIKASASFILF